MRGGAGIGVTITGAEQMRAVGALLKEAGDEGKALRKGLLAEMRSAEQEGLQKAKESALANLPKRGGLNEWVAASKFASRNRLTGRTVGVSLIASKAGGRQGQHDVEATDAGTFRHPVFGHKVWVEQSINPGWWTNALTSLAPELQIKLLAAMAAIEELVTKG
jgi:hypothetical protein